MGERRALGEGFADFRHGDRREHDRVDAELGQRGTQRQRVDDGAEHAHVVARHPVPALRGDGDAAEDVATADDDRDLDAEPARFGDVGGDPVHDRDVDPNPWVVEVGQGRRAGPRRSGSSSRWRSWPASSGVAGLAEGVEGLAASGRVGRAVGEDVEQGGSGGGIAEGEGQGGRLGADVGVAAFEQRPEDGGPAFGHGDLAAALQGLDDAVEDGLRASVDSASPSPSTSRAMASSVPMAPMRRTVYPAAAGSATRPPGRAPGPARRRPSAPGRTSTSAGGCGRPRPRRASRPSRIAQLADESTGIRWRAEARRGGRRVKGRTWPARRSFASCSSVAWRSSIARRMVQARTCGSSSARPVI